MKKYLLVIAIATVGWFSIGYAQFANYLLSIDLAPSPSNGDCLTTDGTDNVWDDCGAGGGSSKWTDGGTFIFPVAGESVSGSFFSGTSTTATSTFVNASSTRFCLSSDCRTIWPASGLSTTTPWTNGSLAYVTGLGTVGSVATGTLTETVTGLEFDQTRGLVGGAAIMALTSGYGIPLTASTTEWANFYNTPSTRIAAGNYLSWSTNTLNASVQISTSSSNGNLAFWTGSSALGNVATGTLTEGVTGLEFSATRGLVGGAAILNITSGYGIPLTASSTEWANFYNTPSTRITAGTGIDWTGNTLNGVYTAGDALTLTGEDFDFDGGASPGGSLGGTWASPTIDDLFLFNNGDIGTGAYDFGGATTFEIPNGTAPTATGVGEIAHDTTGNQLIVDDYVVPLADVKIWSTTIASTSDAFLSSGLVPVPTQLDGYTITRIQCHVSGGTSKVIAVEDASGNSSEDVTCGVSNTTDDGSITNATYTANELSYIDLGATVGSVNYVTISVFGVWTRE